LSSPAAPTTATAAAAGAGYATVPNVALKGRLGRIVVTFPTDAPCKDSRVNIYKQGEDKEIKNFYGSGAVELLPGTYAVSMYGRRVDGVQVTSRNDAKITTGVLRVHASKETRTEVLDQDGKTPLGNAYGDHEFGLPAGKYFIQVNGQSEPVEIKPDQISDF